MRTRFLSLPVAVVLVAIAGCVTVPTGPTVAVMPGSQKPFEVFRADDAECRTCVCANRRPAGEQAAMNSAAATAIASTLIGAAAGAAIDPSVATPDRAPRSAQDQPAVRQRGGQQRRGIFVLLHAAYYDTAYLQCMYAKGNKVPANPHYGGAPYYAYPAPNAYAYPAPAYPPPARY
jgi:hypothetical protein